MAYNNLTMATTETKKRIQKLMIDRDVKGAAIARKVGCTRQNVYHVITGRQVSPHIRRAIAESLGVAVSDLWPVETSEEAA